MPARGIGGGAWRTPDSSWASQAPRVSISGIQPDVSLTAQQSPDGQASTLLGTGSLVARPQDMGLVARVLHKGLRYQDFPPTFPLSL